MKNENGLTLVELLAVVGVVAVLVVLALSGFQLFQRESDLNNSAEEIINALRLARSKTLASEGASQWGVNFSTSTDPEQYILFRGADFASRDNSFDEIHQLPNSVEIYEINFTSASSSIIFQRITGQVPAIAIQSLSLRLKADPAKVQTIYIKNSGEVGLQ